MKKLVYFVNLLLILSFNVSCNNEDIASVPSFENHDADFFAVSRTAVNNNPEIEKSFPNEEKELITLPNGVVVEKYDSVYILQGDIILSPEQVDYLNSSNEGRASLIGNLINYWKNHTVYYQMQQGYLDQNITESAMSAWSAVTGIDFVEGTGTGDYVVFRNSTNGSTDSNPGRIGGRQYVNINHNHATRGTIIHEIGHALGLLHEHCREDRDQHVIVKWNNIPSALVPKYQKNSLNGFNNAIDFGTFDFNSIMMYSSYDDNAIDPFRPVMTKTNGQDFSRNRDSISVKDAEAIKAIYGPPYHKLVKNIVDYNYQDGGGISEYWRESSDYVLYFYRDKSCTIRTRLIHDRQVKIRYSYTSIINGYYDTFTTTSVITIPAGSYSYGVGSAIEDIRSEYGIETGSTESYSLEW